MDKSRRDVASFGAMILIIDNYDSFVHNLARFFRQLGHETLVIRNDHPIPSDLSPAAIVISPGPCTPNQAGCSLALVERYHEGYVERCERKHECEIPILGVCLGHQVIVQALGGTIVRANSPMHGRSSVIRHHNDRLFCDIPSPMTVGRYHSLIAEPTSLPKQLEIIAATEDGTIMAVRHRTRPIFGVQFHPESILTPLGHVLIRNFLQIAGLHIETNSELAKANV